MRLVLFVCSFVFCAFAGCGESSGRVAFSGSVTLSGLPVSGEIRFSPVETGPMATTRIDNGQYLFTTDNGPLPGEYEVTIESVPATTKKGASTESVAPLKWRLRRRIDAGSMVESNFLLEPTSAIESE